MNRLIHLKKATPLSVVTIALACFGFLPQLQAVAPTPDGCYPNYTTAEGCNALNFLTTGAGNTGLGWYSLFSDSTGGFNTGVGSGALALNNADSNTAVGAAALLLNTSGTENTAVGTDAMVFNDTGFNNTAVGAFAFFSNVDSNNNTAVGHQALENDVTGNYNNAFGTSAIRGNMSGNANNAFGSSALRDLTSGNANTGLGNAAGVGLETGSGNVYIGSNAFAGSSDEDNHTYIRNIKDTTVGGGDADIVTVNLTTGLLIHASSSRRYKEDIKPMEKASEALYRLKPVTFRYKKEVDRTRSPAFGLIAEEVAEVNPALVVCDREGQVESVHYEMVNAMLLNEFLKEHRKVQEQEATLTQQRKDFEAAVAQQQKEIAALAATVKEQATQIQRASDELQLRRPAPALVRNR